MSKKFETREGKNISENILKQIEVIARKKMTSCSAHGFDHVERVMNLSLSLAKKEKEKVDLGVLKVAVLLHDIGVAKEMENSSGEIDHAIEGAEEADRILKKFGVEENKISHIKNCIISHRYKTDKKPKTIEAKILFDADKLETLGAVGIARAFAWIGKNNAYIYRKPRNLKAYIDKNLGGKINGRIKDKSKHSPQINWETKDKYLIDRINTKEAKKIARSRKAFSGMFLDCLEKEIKGKK